MWYLYYLKTKTPQKKGNKSVKKEEEKTKQIIDDPNKDNENTSGKNGMEKKW